MDSGANFILNMKMISEMDYSTHLVISSSQNDGIPSPVHKYSTAPSLMVSVTYVMSSLTFYGGTLRLAHHGRRASLPVLDNSMPHARPYLLRVGGQGEAMGHLLGEWDDSFETRSNDVPMWWVKSYGVAILWGNQHPLSAAIIKIFKVP